MIDQRTALSAAPTANLADEPASGAAPACQATRGPHPPASLIVDGAAIRDEYFREYQPVGPTERSLCGSLARHAAAQEWSGEATLAVLREGARKLPTLGIPLPADEPDPAFPHDAVLAAAVSSEAADRAVRHELDRDRAFLKTLKELIEIQDRRRMRERLLFLAPPPGFRDEAACIEYLAARYYAGMISCPSCGETKGYLIPRRPCWECAGCHRQIGLRTGTVFARSGLSLFTWFEATRWLVWRPTLPIAELAQRLKVQRLDTVRAIARRIREALSEENSSGLLAGLDVYFAREAT